MVLMFQFRKVNPNLESKLISLSIFNNLVRLVDHGGFLITL